MTEEEKAERVHKLASNLNILLEGENTHVVINTLCYLLGYTVKNCLKDQSSIDDSLNSLFWYVKEIAVSNEIS